MRQIQQVFLTFVLLIITPLSHAKLVQIIHTNDLHSYFTGYYSGLGGYPRVMTKIKEIRSEAEKNGIEVLQLDAGDWGEGTSFFLSDNGADSIRALEMMGVEVAAIGNHDHLLGGKSLGTQIRAADVKTKFITANLQQTPDMDLGDVVKPYVDVERAGIPIRIIGLTTNDLYFQYSIAPGKILPPIPIGVARADEAKQAGKQLVIALTHIGVTQDESLARNSRSIDVIIGGHTHSKLTDVDWVKNKNGKNIPIVQAWAHGLAVGSLLLDVKDTGDVSVVEYKLHEISGPIAPDPSMENFVARASEKRNANLQYNWNDVIGESEVPMTGYVNGRPVYKTGCWSKHMAKAAKEAVHASLGIHVAQFEGVYRPPGPITYADIASNFPHLRKFGDQGWEIATINVPGWKLRPFIYFVSRRGMGVTFSGLGYNTLPDKSVQLLVNGEPVDEKGVYSVAFPAEVALAIKTTMTGYKKYLTNLRYSGKYYWPSLVEYIKENSPINCN